MSYNEWTVSGEVIYIKEFTDWKEFHASIKIRGVSARSGCSSKQILEFGCLLSKTTYERAVEMGMDKYKNITATGHIESWVSQSGSGDKIKTRFVCDEVVTVD